MVEGAGAGAGLAGGARSRETRGGQVLASPASAPSLPRAAAVHPPVSRVLQIKRLSPFPTRSKHPFFLSRGWCAGPASCAALMGLLPGQSLCRDFQRLSKAPGCVTPGIYAMCVSL